MISANPKRYTPLGCTLDLGPLWGTDSPMVPAQGTGRALAMWALGPGDGLRFLGNKRWGSERRAHRAPWAAELLGGPGASEMGRPWPASEEDLSVDSRAVMFHNVWPRSVATHGET